MKAYKTVLLSVMPLLLVSCTVGPDYETPVFKPPDHFVLQDVLDELGRTTDGETLPVNWWEGFSDPLLNRLVENALKENYRIEAAAARLREAQARRLLAGAGDNLQGDLNAGSSLAEEVDLSGDEDSQRSFDVFGAFSLFLPVDLFGRTARRVESAEAGIEAAESDLRGVILEVSSEVTAEYLRLRGNQRQLELLRESVALQEKTLAIVKSRYESGLSPELDLRRAETSVARLQADIPPLRESLINARNRLASFTGQYPGAYEQSLKIPENIPVYQSRVPHLVPLEVLRMRPDIQQAESVLKQAVAGIGISEAEYYPEFDIAGEVSIGMTGVTGTPPADVLLAAISGLITETLLDGGARKAGVAIAEAQAEEALAGYKQTLLDAVREVETTLAALQASRASQDSLEKAVRSSSRSFDQAETLYQQGLISFLDVVDAQRVLADVEQELASERTQYATQIAALFRVLGTAVKPQAAGDAAPPS